METITQGFGIAVRIVAVSRAALALALSVAAFAFVFGLPWHDFGVWRENEMPSVAIHLASALAAVSITALVSVGDRRGLGAVTSKPLLALAGIGLSSMALAPFTLDTWQSIHGSMKHGIGALWHLELAVLAASWLALPEGWPRKTVMSAVVTSSMALMAMEAWPNVFGRPVGFYEWYGLLGTAVAGFLCLGAKKIASVRFFAGVLFFTVGLWISGNRTVVLVVAAATVVAIASRYLPWKQVTRTTAAVSVLIAVAGFAALWAAAPVIEAYRLPETRSISASAVASSNPLDQIRLNWHPTATIWSRSHMIRTVVSDLWSSPITLLHGNGWGQFAHVSQKHLREVPGRLFPIEHPGASRTYWDANAKADFHPHNVSAEALSAGGLVVFGFWLAFLGCLAASSRMGSIVSVGLAVASTFWFPMVQMTAVLAVLVGTGSTLGRPRPKVAKAIRNMAMLPGMAMFSVMVGAGLAAWNLAAVMVGEREFAGVSANRNADTCRAVEAPFLPEAEANRYLYRILANRVDRATDKESYVFDKGTNFILLSCALRRSYRKGGDLLSLIDSLEIRARVLSVGPTTYGFLSDDIISWGDDLRLLLSNAPGRTDLVIPYIRFSQVRKPDFAASEAAGFAAGMDDTDPVREYLLSVVMDVEQVPRMRDEHLRRALRLGLANVMRVHPAMLDTLERGQ